MTSSNNYKFDSMYNYDFMDYININSESTKVLCYDGPKKYSNKKSTTKFYKASDELYNFDISILSGINVINPSEDFNMNEVVFEIGGSVANRVNFQVFPMRFNESKDTDFIKTFNRNNSVNYKFGSSQNMFTFFTSSLYYHYLGFVFDFYGTFERIELVFNVYNVGNNFSMKSKEMMINTEMNTTLNFNKENQRRLLFDYNIRNNNTEDVLYFRNLRKEDIKYIKYCDNNYNVKSELDLDRLVEFNNTLIVSKKSNATCIDIALNYDKDVTLINYVPNYQRYMSGMSGLAYVGGVYFRTMTSFINTMALAMLNNNNELTEELQETDNLNINKILVRLKEMRFNIDFNTIYYVTAKYLDIKTRTIRRMELSRK